MKCRFVCVAAYLTIALSILVQTEKLPANPGYGGFQQGFIVLAGQAATHIPMELVLAVDEDPNPHGWYFTGPTFEDHPVEGRWTDEGIALNGRAGDRLSLKYMREHSTPRPGEALSLYVITTLKGTLSLPSGQQSITLQIQFARGPLQNGRWYDFGKSDVVIEKNAQAFLRAVEAGNAVAASRYVDFPLTTFIGRETAKIRSAPQFIRLYNSIFPSGVKGRARLALPHDMFCRDGMAMVLNGEVWFSAKGAVSEWLSPVTTKPPQHTTP